MENDPGPGKKLQAVMHEKKVSTRGLEKLTDGKVSYSAISRYCCGNRMISDDVAKTLAAALKVKPSDIK